MSFVGTSEIDVSLLWERLGTFYNNLPPEEKGFVETYWKALFDGIEGLYYNLAQYTLPNFISHSNGYIEHEEFEIPLTSGQATFTYAQSPEPVLVEAIVPGSTIYSYIVTSVTGLGESEYVKPAILFEGSANTNELSWPLVSGATAYNVYGRLPGEHKFIAQVTTNSFSDDGSITVGLNRPPSINTAKTDFTFNLIGETLYLSIPTLTHTITKTVLYENVDYVIEKFRRIRMLKPSEFRYGLYLANNTISMPTIIPEVFFRSLGASTPLNILDDYKYTPYLNTWDSLDYTEQRKLWAWHLNKWINALILRTKGGPTLKNIRETVDLLFNIPFTYEAGTVTDITGSNITIGSFTYDVPEYLTPIITSGQQLAKFDLLCDGSEVNDYISNASLIEALVDSDLKKYYALAICIPSGMYSLNYHDPFFQYLKTSIVPPGLEIYDCSTLPEPPPPPEPEKELGLIKEIEGAILEPNILGLTSETLELTEFDGLIHEPILLSGVSSLHITALISGSTITPYILDEAPVVIIASGISQPTQELLANNNATITLIP